MQMETHIKDSFIITCTKVKAQWCTLMELLTKATGDLIFGMAMEF